MILLKTVFYSLSTTQSVRVLTGWWLIHDALNGISLLRRLLGAMVHAPPVSQ